MLIVTWAVVTLVLLAALAIDVGFIWTGRTQGQSAVDAAALAGAANLISQAGDAVTVTRARQTAKQVVQNNRVIRGDPLALQDEDIVLGNWNPISRLFDDTVPTTDPDVINAVRVELRQDGTQNQQPPLFLAGLLDIATNADDGAPSISVNNSAIGYLGWPGDFAIGAFELPIAIDSAELTSAQCGSDFCETVATPPNACSLDFPEPGDPPNSVTCLEFTTFGPNHNACWTSLDDDDSVSLGNLRSIVRNGSPDELVAGDFVNVAQTFANQTTVQSDIRDRFYGFGTYDGDPSARDQYGTTELDSWVVRLPVIESQDGSFCSGSAEVIGAVCFEIREITSSLSPTPTPFSIKGRFLCPESTNPDVRARFQEFCSTQPTDPSAEPLGSGPGGCNLGLRANRAVLVR